MYGCTITLYLCPQLRRSWRGILVSGCPSVRPSIRPCVGSSVRQEPCMLGFWNFIYGFLNRNHGKIADTRFFFVFVFFYLFIYLFYFIYLFIFFLLFFFLDLPFWSYASLKKIRMKSDACHNLWTVYARVLKFHIWIPHGKIADPYFNSYLPFWSYVPLKKIRMKSCQQDISKRIWARGLESWSADRG